MSSKHTKLDTLRSAASTMASRLSLKRGWSKLGQREQDTSGVDETFSPALTRTRQFDSRQPTSEERQRIEAYTLGSGTEAEDWAKVDFKVWRKGLCANLEAQAWPGTGDGGLGAQLAYWRSFDVKAYRAKRDEAAKAQSEADSNMGGSFGLSRQ